LKYVSEHSDGKVIFMDSGAAAAARIVQGISGMDLGGHDPRRPAPAKV
jgi:hypothetical protein